MFFGIVNFVSSSDSGTRLTHKYRINSLLLLLAALSAMFVGIEIGVLLICKVIPYTSSLGNFLVYS